jgi:ribonuclease HII
VKEIEKRLQSISQEHDPFLKEIMSDGRKGVQQLLQKWFKQYEKKQEAVNKFHQMSAYENKARKEGFHHIAGIDEVGRGPLAGPVVTACVILPEDFTLIGLNDSKQLSEAKREEFYTYIKEKAVSIGIGIIGAAEIDRINIYEATKKAMLLSIQESSIQPDYLLIDAMKLDTPFPAESIIKGDSKSISIAAASVIAKVTRDRMMKEIDVEYPQYHFSRNMGYGTKEHLAALEQFGITPYHRKSFEPIKSMTK